jgi:hypothetical protein
MWVQFGLFEKVVRRHKNHSQHSIEDPLNCIINIIMVGFGVSLLTTNSSEMGNSSSSSSGVSSAGGVSSGTGGAGVPTSSSGGSENYDFRNVDGTDVPTFDSAPVLGSKSSDEIFKDLETRKSQTGHKFSDCMLTENSRFTIAGVFVGFVIGRVS